MRLILSSKKRAECVNVELTRNLLRDPAEDTPDVAKLSFINECSDWWKANLSKTTVMPSPSRSDIVSIQVTEQDKDTFETVSP